MANFITSKRADINESNRAEFLDHSALNEISGEGAARTATTKIDRAQQMKVSVVDNHEGPRSQLTTPNSLPPAVEERLRNLETYMEIPTGRFGQEDRRPSIQFPTLCCVLVKSVPNDIYQRLKQIEDKLLQIEQDPFVYFNLERNRVLYPHVSRLLEVRYN